LNAVSKIRSGYLNWGVKSLGCKKPTSGYEKIVILANESPYHRNDTTYRHTYTMDR